MRRLVPIGLALVTVGLFPAGPRAGAATACRSPLLVLSAFPGEIDGLLGAASVEETVVADGRAFYVGRLRGHDVVLALTGIGLVNARQTTETAIGRFRCAGRPAIAGAVFSGVAGGRSFIGDVTVPGRWTPDDGKTWLPADRAMLATARAVARSGRVELARAAPVGDPACVGVDPDLIRTVEVTRAPRILVGGDGKSADPFGGRRFPCTPGGGDVFGCEPCRAPSRQAPDVARFVTGILPFVDPDFFLSYFENPPPAGTRYAAEDMETAAVARVAARHGIPFIAFRGVSDGRGDALMLPGFPFQFFYYRQLAADNAAAVALAFLESWKAKGRG